MKTGLIIFFDETDAAYARQIAKLDLDIIGIHPWGGAQSRESIDLTLERIKTDEYREFARIIRESGKKTEFEAHVHSWLLPKELFAEHPLWFRQDASGKRNSDYNMCVSNREGLEYLAAGAEKLAGLLVSDTSDYYWWSDDAGGDCFCHCPECAKLSLSDQYLIWCNTVLKGIRRKDPKARLCYLAYFGTMKRPETVRPAEGIFLEFAPIRRDSFIPIDNPDCEKNRDEIVHLKETLDFFGAKNSRVLEYWLDNSRFSQWKKPLRKMQFDTEIMSRDVRYYKSLGFESLTCFACSLGTEYQKEYSPPDFNAYAALLRR